MHSADISNVAQPGATIDQGVIVVALHVRAQGIEKFCAMQVIVEVVPVQGAEGRLVIAVLPTGWQEVHTTVAGKLPAKRNSIIFQAVDALINETDDPTAGCLPGLFTAG